MFLERSGLSGYGSQLILIINPGTMSLHGNLGEKPMCIDEKDFNFGIQAVILLKTNKQTNKNLSMAQREGKPFPLP